MCTLLSKSHKLSQTRVTKRQWLQSFWWSWCRLEWRPWWQALTYWFFLQTEIQWVNSQLANQDTADSGPLFLRSRIPGFGCSSPRSHWCVKWATRPCRQQLLAKTTRAASNWLPTLLCINDPIISIWKITSYEKTLMKTQFNWSTRPPINWQPNCWQIISSTQSWATSRTIIGSYANTSSRKRNNLSEGKEEKNSVKCLELQN